MFNPVYRLAIDAQQRMRLGPAVGRALRTTVVVPRQVCIFEQLPCAGVAWHERASGSEEELVVAEPLLAFRAGRAEDVHLLFGRDDGVALGAAVLTRAAGGWRVQWESAVAGCD